MLEKYAILIDRRIDDNVDEEVFGIYDTQKEAEGCVENAIDSLLEKDGETAEVSLVRITEDMLDNKDDWNSFRDSEELFIYSVETE